MTTRIDEETLSDAIRTRFECLRCGHCCQGDGIVTFNAVKAGAMARLLGLTRRQFLKTYAIRVKTGQWMLKDRMVKTGNPNQPGEKWCIFLEQDSSGLYQCRVNESKPDQCDSFPTQWRNTDSLKTCAGLRNLTAALRRAARESA